MKAVKTVLILATFWLAGCSSTRPYPPAATEVRAYCPNGTVMVCASDSLRGCRCGELIVLN